jgi:predicted small lipoprotein YifL
MSLMLQILVRAGSFIALVTLMACGQQGPLYLPQTTGRPPASLPESLLPTRAAKDTLPTTQVPASGVKPQVPSAIQ